MSTDIPAVAFGVVRMEAQVEPVDAQTARMRRAWSGNTARAPYRDANRFDGRAGHARQHRRDRSFIRGLPA
ncbi:hypothetical protein [Burkholderia stabilis]|uniref:hypothetical protein n=1 Tax=Burkholderia stabilis TaxID=95485 RepID=UPI00155FC603|nr:hypothetical protein [Burkholderia stabilis]